MTQIATNKEQSARLIACGVDPNTADMCYLYWDESGEQLSREEYLEIFNESFLDGRVELVPKDFGDYDHSYEIDSPAWSLSALLALLPIEVNEEGLQTVIHLTHYPDELKWAAEYYDYAMDMYLCSERDYTPIGACVKAIEWLTANNYNLNNNG